MIQLVYWMCQPWYYPFNSSQKWASKYWIEETNYCCLTKKSSLPINTDYAKHSTKLTMLVAVHDYNVVLSNQADGHAIHDYNSSKIVFFGELFWIKCQRTFRYRWIFIQDG